MQDRNWQHLLSGGTAWVEVDAEHATPLDALDEDASSLRTWPLPGGIQGFHLASASRAPFSPSLRSLLKRVSGVCGGKQIVGQSDSARDSVSVEKCMQ